VAIIVVGGSGKGVGKTSLVCGLIAALPEFQWTAVKVTSHSYGATAPIWEETEAGLGTDTARYLEAGADRALLVGSGSGLVPLDELWAAVGRGADLIFESNTIAGQVEADLCLGVVGSEADVKPSFEPFMMRMDAAVVVAGARTVLGAGELTVPVFRLEHMERVSPEMVRWVRGRLRPAD
jgi:hypothetical protein